MVATKKLGKWVLVSSKPQNFFGAASETVLRQRVPGTHPASRKGIKFLGHRASGAVRNDLLVSQHHRPNHSASSPSYLAEETDG